MYILLDFLIIVFKRLKYNSKCVTECVMCRLSLASLHHFKTLAIISNNGFCKKYKALSGNITQHNIITLIRSSVLLQT